MLITSYNNIILGKSTNIKEDLKNCIIILNDNYDAFKKVVNKIGKFKGSEEIYQQHKEKQLQLWGIKIYNKFFEKIN